MASAAPPSQQPSPPNNIAPTAAAKKKNKKKKSAAARANAHAAAAAAPTTPPADAGGEDEDNADGPDEPAVTDEAKEIRANSPQETNGNGHVRQASTTNGTTTHLAGSRADADTDIDTDSQGQGQGQDRTIPIRAMKQDGDGGEAAAALRREVEQLREQLQGLQAAQEKHTEEAAQLRTDLEESEAGREQAETQYQNLLGRVEKIKETLGERLKRDKQELEEAKDRIDELESQNEALQHGGGAAEKEVEQLRAALSAAEREQASLRSRAQLSQQNWQRERDDWARQMQQLRAELESTSGAMGEWEVIAMEERSVREGLADKAADLEEQLVAARELAERANEERATQAQAVDSLQRALQEIQEARRRELREMVESSEAQLEAVQKRTQEAEAAAEKATAEAEAQRAEVERTAPFEREVKEKNLLIGKLRHETIVLNDHLTKALRYIKKNKPEENVDRQVVTNHLLQFLALDRSDPKKFQILQVIAGVLNWTEEQKEKAGLARPGTSNNTLRLPSSPFHRTPSTPSLNAEFFEPGPASASRESLADLWAGFLERSVEEASEPSRPQSRKGSLPKS